MFTNKVSPLFQTKYEYVLTNFNQFPLKSVKYFHLKMCLPMLLGFAHVFLLVAIFLNIF